MRGDRERRARRQGAQTRDLRLHLTDTAVDTEPFARDPGCAGPPFRWDEEDRRHRMARHAVAAGDLETLVQV